MGNRRGQGWGGKLPLTISPWIAMNYVGRHQTISSIHCQHWGVWHSNSNTYSYNWQSSTLLAKIVGNRLFCQRVGSTTTSSPMYEVPCLVEDISLQQWQVRQNLLQFDKHGMIEKSCQIELLRHFAILVHVSEISVMRDIISWVTYLILQWKYSLNKRLPLA